MTTNSVKGWVRWSYHVAPIVKLNDHKLYVLDPALSPHPIEKEMWHQLCTNGRYPGDLQSRLTGYVTCEHDTYAPHQDCFNPIFFNLGFNADDCSKFQAQIYLRL